MQGYRCLLGCVLSALLSCLGLPATAAGSGALIDARDTGLRRDLEWLADRRLIDLGLGTWPLPLVVVTSALAGARPGVWAPADRNALERVQAALARLDDEAVLAFGLNSARQSIADAGPVVRARSEAAVQLQKNESEMSLRLRLGVQQQPLARNPSRATLDGSFFAIHVPGAVVSFGALDSWWGPALYSSPILGNAAPPVPRLTVRRDSESAPETAALSWLGPWSYEVSVGRPSHYHPGGAFTIGIRLTARPVAGLELGLSRFVYWGGAGRPKSLGSLGNALLGRSNMDDPSVPDPSNEVAGVDLRWALPTTAATWVAYGHFAGEDEANSTPSKWIATLGLQRKHAGANYRIEWTAEATDTRLGRMFGLRSENLRPAYEHSVYVDGHYHQGLPVGAFIGGGGVLAGIGVAVTPLSSPTAMRLEARLWRAEVSLQGDNPHNAAFGRAGAVNGLTLQGAGAVRSLRWRLGLSIQHRAGTVAQARRDVGVIGGIELPLRQP